MQRGFSLIEFIIYISIVAIFLVSVTGFLWDIVLGNVKTTADQEVQYNTRFALTKIQQAIKGATAINAPVLHSSSNILTLEMRDSLLDPTIFDLFQGKLRVTQGGAGPYDVTTNRVIVQELEFVNLSYVDTPGTVRIGLKIDHINPSGQRAYDVSSHLITSVSLLP